jgi:hypothetical protein
MRKTASIAFVVGCATATILAAAWRIDWHLVDLGRVSFVLSDYYQYSGIASFLWPSSMLMMDVGPREPLSLMLASSYLSVIVLNGALYAMVVAIPFGIVRALSRRFRS